MAASTNQPYPPTGLGPSSLLISEDASHQGSVRYASASATPTARTPGTPEDDYTINEFMIYSPKAGCKFSLSAEPGGQASVQIVPSVTSTKTVQVRPVCHVHVLPQAQKVVRGPAGARRMEAVQVRSAVFPLSSLPSFISLPRVGMKHGRPRSTCHETALGISYRARIMCAHRPVRALCRTRSTLLHVRHEPCDRRLAYASRAHAITCLRLQTPS